jgi:hypothetical protein
MKVLELFEQFTTVGEKHESIKLIAISQTHRFGSEFWGLRARKSAFGIEIVRGQEPMYICS